MRARDPRRLFLRYRKRGDAAALGRVFDLVAPELLAIAVHVTRDVSTAEDAVQDTFLIAVESADRYDASRPLVPWLVGILVNRARKGRARATDPRLRSTGEDGAQLEEVEAASADPAAAVAAHEVGDIVADAVAGLSEPYRSVVHKHLDECAPPRDIAVELGRAPGTVRVQLHRGLEQLRSALAGRNEGGAMERLTGVGLALPAAVQLGDTGTAGLAAAREAVVHAATVHAVSLESAHGTSIVPTVLAVAAAAGALAVIASSIDPRGTGDPADVDRDALVAVAPIEEEPLELAPVAARPKREVRAVQPVARRAARRSAPPGSPGGRLSGATATPEKPPAVAPLEAVPFRVDWRTHWRSARGGERPSIQVRDAAGGVLARADDLFRSDGTLEIGSYETPQDLSLVFLHVDDPDALLEVVPIPVHEWGRSRGGYRAKVKVKLRRVPATIVVGSDEKQPFQGTVQLRSFDERTTQLVDERSLSGAGSGGGVALRHEGTQDMLLVLGIPSEPDRGADAIWTLPSRHGEHRLALGLRRLALPPQAFEVVDPFDEPMPGVEVRAVVPEDLTFPAGTGGTDIVLGMNGWTVANGTDVDASYHSRLDDMQVALEEMQIASEIEAGRTIPMVAARELVSETTSDAGHVTLRGTVPGLHEFQVRTPLNGEPVGDLIRSRTNPRYDPDRKRIVAPIGGVEITAPRGLFDAEGGAAAWERATVTITAGGREIDAARQRSGRFRALVPPSTTLQIVADMGDHGRVSTTVVGVSPGLARTVALPAPEATDED